MAHRAARHVGRHGRVRAAGGDRVAGAAGRLALSGLGPVGRVLRVAVLEAAVAVRPGAGRVRAIPRRREAALHGQAAERDRGEGAVHVAGGERVARHDVAEFAAEGLRGGAPADVGGVGAGADGLRGSPGQLGRRAGRVVLAAVAHGAARAPALSVTLLAADDGGAARAVEVHAVAGLAVGQVAVRRQRVEGGARADHPLGPVAGGDAAAGVTVDAAEAGGLELAVGGGGGRSAQRSRRGGGPARRCRSLGGALRGRAGARRGRRARRRTTTANEQRRGKRGEHAANQARRHAGGTRTHRVTPPFALRCRSLAGVRELRRCGGEPSDRTRVCSKGSLRDPSSTFPLRQHAAERTRCAAPMGIRVRGKGCDAGCYGAV